MLACPFVHGHPLVRSPRLAACGAERVRQEEENIALPPDLTTAPVPWVRLSQSAGGVGVGVTLKGVLSYAILMTHEPSVGCHWFRSVHHAPIGSPTLPPPPRLPSRPLSVMPFQEASSSHVEQSAEKTYSDYYDVVVSEGLVREGVERASSLLPSLPYPPPPTQEPVPSAKGTSKEHLECGSICIPPKQYEPLASSALSRVADPASLKGPPAPPLLTHGERKRPEQTRTCVMSAYLIAHFA